MNLTAAERETIINVNSEDATCYVHTRIPKHHRYYERLGVKPKTIHKDSEGNEYAWDYQLPISYFKLPKAKKHVSEEQRKAVGERFRKARLAHRPC